VRRPDSTGGGNRVPRQGLGVGRPQRDRLRLSRCPPPRTWSASSPAAGACTQADHW